MVHYLRLWLDWQFDFTGMRWLLAVAFICYLVIGGLF